MSAHDAARLLGKLGGKAGTGRAKRRPREHYQAAARLSNQKHNRCKKCGRLFVGNLNMWRHRVRGC